MESISGFTEEMIILYMIAFIGYVARKINVFNEEANHFFTQIILYITLPALILFSLNTSYSFSLLMELSWLLVMSLYILLVAALIANRMAKSSSLPDAQKSVYESLILFGNQGFIGYAVSYILFQEQGILYVTIFNVFYIIFIWTYGIYLFSKTKETMEWRNIFLNPGVIATAVGMILLISPIQLPDLLSGTLEMVGKMTIPLSMIMIGSLVASVSFQHLLRLIKNKYLWLAVLFKLLLLPSLLLVFIYFHVPTAMIMVAVLVTGMPSAPTISIYANKFGGDAHFASLGVLVSTTLCIVTIPFLYVVLRFMLE